MTVYKIEDYRLKFKKAMAVSNYGVFGVVDHFSVFPSMAEKGKAESFRKRKREAARRKHNKQVTDSFNMGKTNNNGGH